MRTAMIGLAALGILGGCATAPTPPPAAALGAPASSLGTPAEPVKAEMPPGQRAYLDRLRCANGRAPVYFRMGNMGPGRDGHIVDRYVVDCGAAAPGRVEIDMDMYHPGHIEGRAVDGFTLVPADVAPSV